MNVSELIQQFITANEPREEVIKALDAVRKQDTQLVPSQDLVEIIEKFGWITPVEWAREYRRFAVKVPVESNLDKSFSSWHPAHKQLAALHLADQLESTVEQINPESVLFTVYTALREVEF